MPLAESPNTEVRVWKTGPFGVVVGWVVTELSVQVFSNQQKSSSGTTEVNPDKLYLLRSIRSPGASSILKELVSLQRLDGQGFDCGVKDGVGYTMAGHSHEGQFALAASNPASCKLPESEEIARVLERLRSYASDAL